MNGKHIFLLDVHRISFTQLLVKRGGSEYHCAKCEPKFNNISISCFVFSPFRLKHSYLLDKYFLRFAVDVRQEMLEEAQRKLMNLLNSTEGKIDK